MKRNLNNPIITRNDIPNIQPNLVDITSVFNQGAIKFKDKYLLILRVQNRARELYETVGQVPNVIFPTVIIVEDIDENGFAFPDSEVKLYYGAADTVVGLAKLQFKELIKKCY
ncbi:MAG: hypothetical protein K8S23_07500 [Candidatus Cloacimonetes bacterium]|nr:hypothetical protein [Candidatus Cloacimonadota bacterium]